MDWREAQNIERCRSHWNTPDPICPRCRYVVLTIYGRAGYVTWMHATGHKVPEDYKGGESMGIMNRLQSMNINKLDLDEAVELSTLAKSLREGYERHNLSSPMILDDSIRQLDRYIGDQVRDRMVMELRELAQADAADMSASERRQSRATRRAEIEARLGMTSETKV